MARRSGWRRGSALALAALALATACPNRARTPGPGSSPRGRRGGAVTVAYPWEPATLDPFTLAGDGPPTRDLVRLVMPGLWRLGPGASRERWLLAEDPRTEGDPPRTVTLTLRDDATWSDGRPITVEDLRATWRRALAGPPSVRDGYDRIASITAETPKRARVRFRAPFRRWDALFAAGLGVVPARAGSLGRSWPLSGGPFVLRAWHRGLDMVFERNARAWGGAPPLDRLRVVFVPDAGGALELFRRGSVDVLGPYLAPDWSRRVAGADATRDTGLTWAGLVLNTGAGPLREPAVRRALFDSLDRRRILEGLVGSEGEELQSADPGGDRGPYFPRIAAGAAAAGQELARAGWRGAPVRRKGGARLSFTVAVVGNDDLAAVVVRAAQYQAARAGFDLQAVALDADVFWRDWLPGGRFRAALVVWRDPPGGAARARFGAQPNRARLRDAPLLALLDAADRQSSAPSRFGDPLPRAQRHLVGVVPVVPLYLVTVTLAARPDALCGVRASAAADGPFWNAGEWSRGPCA